MSPRQGEEEWLERARLYDKGGFIIERRPRRKAYKAGQFKDLLLMGMCVHASEPGKVKV